MNILVVVNPNAGRQQFQKGLEPIQRKFEESGAAVEVLTTHSREMADEVLQGSVPALDFTPDLLVCCGGDGTLNETVNALLEGGRMLPVGYIPAGTTNDFANSLGIPKDPLKAADAILRGEPHPLDVGRFGGKRFIYVASFGAFTQTSYSTTQNLKSSLGHLAYIIEGIKELPQLKSYHVRVETEENAYEGEYLFGSVSNSTSLGGIIRLDSGKVDLSDGKFELTLVKKPRNLIELNKILFSLMSGKYEEELITFVHVNRAVFTCPEAMPWSLDGEYAAGGGRVEIETLPHALTMVY